MSEEQSYIVKYTYTNGYRCGCCIQTWNKFNILNKEQINKILDDYRENDLDTVHDDTEIYKIMVYDIQQIKSHHIRQVKDFGPFWHVEPDLEEYKPVAYFIKDWHHSKRNQYKYTHLIVKKVGEREQIKSNKDSELPWELFKINLDIDIITDDKNVKIKELERLEDNMKKVKSSIEEYDNRIKNLEKILDQKVNEISRTNRKF